MLAFEQPGVTRWDAVLGGLSSHALDCVQSTLAVIADEAYGSGAHLVLGCSWRFPTLRPDGTIGTQPSPEERIAEGSELLGIEFGEPEGPVRAPELRRLADGGPLFIVSEAYDLRWLPYAKSPARHRRRPHSFLLERDRSAYYTVVDAYYADTEWGRARPAAWTLLPEQVDQAIGGEVTALRIRAIGPRPNVELAVVLARNATNVRLAARDIDAYAASVRAGLGRPEGIERLVLDISHLLRERLLNQLWLGDHPASAAVGGSVGQWQQLAAHSYLAMRRSSRGPAPSTALVDDLIGLLRADAALVARLASAAPVAVSRAITDAVHDAVRATLRLDDRAIDPTCALRSLPNFDSFRLVEIIDRAEADLRVTVPSDASPDDLADVAGLCRLFARAAAVSQA